MWAEEPEGSLYAYKAFKKRYRDMPDQFALDCIDWKSGENLTNYQLEILRCIPEKKRVSVRGPHGLGKTALAAITILWFALTRDGEDWKIATTASAWRQLTKFLWPEIHKWSRRIRWDIVGRPAFSETTELFTQSLRLDTGEAFAMASDDSQLIEGAHADNLLYIFDESKVIPDETWDSAEGAFSSGLCYWLAISTPGENIGRFYDIHTRKPGYEDWYVRAVKLSEAINAGRINADWAEGRKRQWGAKSARYLNRVLGEFADSDGDAIIPLSWIELANERWLDWKEAGDPGNCTKIGVDVARMGDDYTVLAYRYDYAIDELEKHGKEDTMVTAGHIVKALRKHPHAVASVDVVGVGAGPYDRAREQLPGRLEAFVASAKTDFVDVSEEMRFADTRSAAWWYMRQLLDPGFGSNIALPPDDELVGELMTPKWRSMSNGVVRVESKDDIMKRLRRSTNTGDAVIQAFWGGVVEEGMEFA